ncbi:MAG: septation protein A [Hyphomicrobiaceae bacterium]|nr:MAG: septation protein A [Hyphomicrobiaceae bacterium]
MSKPNTLAPASKEAPSPKGQLMKVGLELAPLIIFFLVNAKAGIFPAVLALTIATAVSLTAMLWLFRKVAPMPLVSAALVFVFAGLTWYFQNETFIKIKPTIVYLLFAAPLLLGLLFKRPLLQLMLEDAMQLKEEGWWTLSLRWGLFFVAMAVLNEIAWRNFSTDTWAALKIGFVLLAMVFGVAQVPLILKHQVESAKLPNA